MSFEDLDIKGIKFSLNQLSEKLEQLRGHL